jgi:hypothetical protein
MLWKTLLGAAGLYVSCVPQALVIHSFSQRQIVAQRRVCAPKSLTLKGAFGVMLGFPNGFGTSVRAFS